MNGVKQPPSFSYLQSVKGLCDNITSGAVVDVFYAKAGQSHETPLYVVVGASVKYVLSL